METIKRGSKGDAVKVLQYLLGGLTPDGIFGGNTESTVKGFQDKHHLEDDGIVGKNTWRAVAQAAPTIRKGSKGDAVRAAQLLAGVSADGIFGAKTKSAVAAYQKAAGLSADGVVGPLTWQAMLCGVAAKEAKKPVNYKQYDSRWGGVMYSNHGDKTQTIKSSGCGPTAMANIVATWFDDDVTPVEMCAFAKAWGYRTYNDGTSWGFFDKVAKTWTFSKYKRTGSTDEVIAALNEGALVVALMGKGYWTKGGHYITLWKSDGKYIYANDPASATRTKATVAKFKAERKQYFIFWF